MSENTNERTSESYAEIAARKTSYGAFSTPNTPNGWFIGREFSDDSPEHGKLVMLNSKYNRTSYGDCIPAQDDVNGFDEYFNEIDRLMSADPELKIYGAMPRARDYVNDKREAEAAGIDLETFRAKREAEREAENRKKAEAKALRDRVKDLSEKGVKVRASKRGTEIALSGEALEAFKAFMASNGNKTPLAEFLTTGDLGATENPAEITDKKKK